MATIVCRRCVTVKTVTAMENEREGKDLYGLFEPLRDRFLDRVYTINSLSGGSKKCSALLLMLRDVFRDVHVARLGAVTRKDEIAFVGYPMRFFNGRYYEECYTEDMYVALQTWLLRIGVDNSMLLTYQKYIKSEMCRLCLGRELKPCNHIMCFQNGVVDFSLKQFHLMPFDWKYDVVKQYHFDYDMGAYSKAKRWAAFLGEPLMRNVPGDGMLPEAEKRRALRMFLGACLLDRSQVSFEHFAILQGGGSNGKSVVFRTLQELFGEDEIAKIELGQLNRSGDERLRATASLDRKRIAYCPDQCKLGVRDFGVLKSLSSGESVEARRIGHDIQSVSQPPIIMFNANQRWKPSDFMRKEAPGDISLQRRAVIINFERTVPQEKQDTMLVAKFREEHAGIFAWIVKGMMELRRHGYKIPPILNDTIAAKLDAAFRPVPYMGRKLNGSICIFLERKFCVGGDPGNATRIEITLQNFYGLYRDFCIKHGVEPATMTKFSIDLGTLGFAKLRGPFGLFWVVYCTQAIEPSKFRRHIPDLADPISPERMGEEGVEYTDERFLQDMKDFHESQYLDHPMHNTQFEQAYVDDDVTTYEEEQRREYGQ